MEFVIEIIRPVVQSLMVPVKECMGFVVSSSMYVRKMRTRMDQLDATAADVKTHMETNNANNLEIPHRIPDWLEELKTIKAQVESIPTSGIGCYNVKMRYNAGKQSSDILEEMERLLKEASEIKWTNQQKPLGRVETRKASTSAPFPDGALQSSNFESRDLIFKDALRSLQLNDKSQKIALCGMGGVGKTTMMEQLKKVVEDLKMFDWVLKVVIGQNPNPIVVQQAISEQLGEPLTESIKDTRAERLQKRFKSISEDGKKKILVLLDDLWEEINLKDIGLLNPLPNNFKLLLTSREGQVCTNMGVEAKSIIRMDVLKDSEAKILFDEIAGISYDSDPELHEIGEDIIKRCGGLPIAIKTIASTLRDNYKKDAWEDARFRLQHNDSQILHNIVNEIFEISYNNLKEVDDKAIFLLSGLFPDDFDIPMEDLMRYGWGLKLFNNKVYTIAEARRRVNTCIGKLIRANLLTESDHVGCVKMHDLIRAFVLSNFSEPKQASVVNVDDRSQWPAEDTSDCYERVLLKCTHTSEFPKDFNHPNLKLLKLMDGYRLVKFPQDFYQRMEHLEVLAYERIHASLLPVTPQYSTKLRTLCLHSCSLMDDLSFLGDIISLEILSFAKCGIRKLPSTIGKLRKLKLLDLTGCVALHIDSGVFRNLGSLEELYMRVSKWKAVRFTDGNCEELEMLSTKLFALEVEFFNNKVQPKNLSFKNLERFKISMGCLFQKIDDIDSFNNTLNLVTTRSELLECKINELFKKTENLYLEVKDMIHLEDVSSQHSFSNLRVLQVDKCKELSYLFTIPVASNLMKLERLTISKCPILETLVYVVNSGAGSQKAIKFQGLKFLCLKTLPKLVRLCDNETIVELPQLLELELEDLPYFTSIYPENETDAMQPLLNKEIVIPKLEILVIRWMENLKQIWPCQITSSEKLESSILREIDVWRCDSLVNLFPCNPLPLLSHLEKLEVGLCSSIEVLFNIDLGCAGDIEEEVSSSSRLRSIQVKDLWELREVWRVKGANNSPNLLITSFQAVESIEMRGCERFRNLYEPTTINFDLGALAGLVIEYRERLIEWGYSSDYESQEETTAISIEETSKVGDNISNVAFPSSLMHTFHHLGYLQLSYYGVKVVFGVDSPMSEALALTHDIQQSPVLPNLEVLELEHMEMMSHVWKCNWNQFLNLEKHHPKSSFYNLTTIEMSFCSSIKYLFSPLMVKFLVNLKEVKMIQCHGIEEIVSNRDDDFEEMPTSISTNKSANMFPHLHLITLSCLTNLQRIGGCGGGDGAKFSQVGVVSWSLCQYSREISILDCDALSSVIPSYAFGQMQKLEVLRIGECDSMIEVFEESRRINNSVGDSSTNVDEGSFGTITTPAIPRSGNNVKLKLHNLKILKIKRCNLLEYIFTFSSLESLRQLEVLRIKSCKAIKVIVKEDNGELTMASNIVVFPRLKSVALVNLPNLTGFFLGRNEFVWQSLDKVMIRNCPQLMVFTSGQSTGRELKYIHTSLGKHNLECGLNFHVPTTFNQSLQTTSPICLDGSGPTTSDRLPWSFHNLMEVEVIRNYDVKKIIPFNGLLQLQKLEKIYLRSCLYLEEVFEALEWTNTGTNESKTVVKFPNLKQVELKWLNSLNYIFRSNRWTILEFPNVTRVSIDGCKRLQHVFTCSMVGSLLQLQELHVIYCDKIEAIVKAEEEEEYEDKVNEFKLPCLKSLKLIALKSLQGFCSQKGDFSCPSLDILEIKDCPRMMMFNKGRSTIQEQTIVETDFGSFYARKDINSFIKTKRQEGFEFQRTDRVN